MLDQDRARPESELQALAARSVKLLLPAGCLVIWSSRLVHEGTGPSPPQRRRGAAAAAGAAGAAAGQVTAPPPPPPPAGPRLDRITAIVCFGPASWCTEDVRRQRREAYLAGHGTSHWVDKCEVNRVGMEAIHQAKCNFRQLKPRVEADGSIPAERAALL